MTRCALFLALLFAARMASAQGLPPAQAAAPGRPRVISSEPLHGSGSFQIVRSDAQGAELDYAVPALDLGEDTLGGRRYVRAALQGMPSRGKAGEPMLPVRIIRIGVPFGASVQVEVQAAGAPASLEGVPLPQAEPVVEGTGAARRITGEKRVASPAAYSRTQFIPGVLGKLVRIEEMRNQRVAGVELYPVQAAPGLGLMRSYDHLRILAHWSGGTVSPVASPDGPFEDVYRHQVLNYEAARSFRKVKPRSIPNPVGGSSFFTASSSPWIRMHLSQQGMYQVTASDLQSRGGVSAAEMAGIDVSTLRVFTAPTGGLPLDELGDCDSCFLREVDCEVTDAAGAGRTSGNFQVGDRLVFYGTATNGFPEEYWPDTLADPQTSEYLRNQFTNDNVYWLTWGPGSWGAANPPHRMAQVDGGAAAGVSASEMPFRVHLEQDVIEDLTAYSPFAEPLTRWEKFFWENYKNNAADAGGVSYRMPTSSFALTSVDSTQPAELLARFWGDKISYRHQAVITLGSDILGQDVWDSYGRSDIRGFYTPSSYKNQFTLTVPGSLGRLDSYYLAFLEVRYMRRLESVGGQLYFYAPDSTAARGFQISGFSPQRLVYSIQDFGTVRRILGGGVDGFSEVRDGGRGYFVVEPGALQRPTRMERAFAAGERFLKDTGQRGDDLILTYEAFRSSAEELAAWRSQHLPGITSPTVRVADMQQVYDEFSGGRFDPTAIRDCARYAYRNWQGTPLSYLTLVGDCSNDFKNVLRRDPNFDGVTNFVPMFEGSYDAQLGVQYGTDDWFARLDPSSTLTFAVGRIPANNADQARLMIRDKTIAYEQNPEFGTWRNRVLLGADDNLTCDQPDDLGYLHTQQMARQSKLCYGPAVDRDQVFMLEYDFGATGNSCNKPGAERDFLDGINKGARIVSYIGHGNPVTLATEKLFSTQDLSSVHNGRRLNFFLTASCTVGKVDSPDQDGLAEAMMKLPDGGCVGSLSATQEAIAYESVPMSDSILTLLSDVHTGEGRMPIGVATFEGKEISPSSINNSKYVIQGDPALTLATPYYQLLFDGPAVASQGSRVTVQVSAHDFDTGNLVLLNGADSIEVREPPTIRLIRPTGGSDCRTGVDLHYDGYYYDCFEDSTFLEPAGTIYRGAGTIRNGVGQVSFYLPSSSRRGPNAGLRMYASGTAQGAGHDAAGLFSFETVTGSPDTSADSPQIQVQFDGSSSAVTAGSVVHITAHGPHGIYLGPQPTNSLYLVIDDGRRVALSPLFRYQADTDTAGGADYVIPSLDPGTHTLLVSAASNLATAVDKGRHRTQVSARFAVGGSSSSDVTRVFNFPNPVRSGEADLYFDFKDEGDATIRIFTISGATIRTLHAPMVSGTNRIHWDLKDGDGDPVSNGTYLFQVEAHGLFGPSVKGIGKLVVLRN